MPRRAMKFKNALTRIKTTTQSLKIDLHASGISDTKAIILAKSFESLQVQLTINLCYNDISDAGATALFKVFKHLKTPLIISLNFNKISDAGAIVLSNTLKYLKVPVTIYLGHNNIGHVGIKALTDSFSTLQVPLYIDVPTTFNHRDNLALVDATGTNDVIHDLGKKYLLSFMYTTIRNIWGLDVPSSLLREIMQCLPVIDRSTKTLQLIHGANAIVDNQLYTLNNIKLDEFTKIGTHCSANALESKHYTIIKTYLFTMPCFTFLKATDIYKGAESFFSRCIDSRKKARMQQVAQEHGVTIDINNLSVKQVYLPLAKKLHPDKKGGDGEAFIRLDDMYKASPKMVVEKFVHGVQISIHNINTALKGVSLGTNVLRLVHCYKSDHCTTNDLISNGVDFAKDSLILMGRIYKFEGSAKFMIAAPLLEIAPALYAEDYQDALNSIMTSLFYSGILILAYQASPIIALVVETGLLIYTAHELIQNVHSLYNELLHTDNVQVSEIQEQQCYISEDATCLANVIGTIAIEEEELEVYKTTVF